MQPFVRRFAVLLLAATFALTSSSCSNKPKPEIEVGLTQTEADDLAQQVGAMVATDLGGWLIEVQSTAASVPLGSPTAIESRHAPARVMRDTTIDQATMHWRIHLTYQQSADANDTTGAWSDTAVAANGLAFAKGTLVIPPLGARTGSIGYGRDSSSFLAQDLGVVADTAISFDGFCNHDTALTTLQDGTATRYYYLDNIVDYEDLVMQRGPTAPDYPVGGQVRIDIIADVLYSPVHLTSADKQNTLDAVMVITFEPSQTPMVTITAATESATAVYRYRLDLKTGVLTRL